MKILIVRFVSSLFLLAGVCAAQSQGNLPVYSGSTAITNATPVVNEIHSTAFTTPTLHTLVTACGTTNPCKIVLDPSTTMMDVGGTYPVTIGSLTQHVIVENQGVVLQCSGSHPGTDCIDIAVNGSLVCAAKGVGGTGCQIQADTAANFTSFVSNAVKTGAQTDFTVTGHNFVGNGMMTISKGLLYLVAVEGKGIVASNSFIANKTGVVNIEIEDGPSTGSMNNVTFLNNASYCGSVTTTCLPLHIASGAGSNSGNGYYFFGLNVGDGLMATGSGVVNCQDGNGCLIDIDGDSNGSGENTPATSIQNIIFAGLYIEGTTGQPTASHYISIKNVHNLDINGLEVNVGNSVTDCFLITATTAGALGRIHLAGHNSSGHCSNLLNNTITGTTIGSGVDFDYLYPGDASVGFYVDGPVVMTGGATLTTTAGAPTTNCTIGSLNTNTSASSASTVLYVCYPANTWTAVTVP